jgi:hypothetical protein
VLITYGIFTRWVQDSFEISETTFANLAQLPYSLRGSQSLADSVELADRRATGVDPDASMPSSAASLNFASSIIYGCGKK